MYIKISEKKYHKIFESNVLHAKLKTCTLKYTRICFDKNKQRQELVDIYHEAIIIDIILI